jgi:hypothetical protein
LREAGPCSRRSASPRFQPRDSPAYLAVRERRRYVGPAGVLERVSPGFGDWRHADDHIGQGRRRERLVLTPQAACATPSTSTTATPTRPKTRRSDTRAGRPCRATVSPCFARTRARLRPSLRRQHGRGRTIAARPSKSRTYNLSAVAKTAPLSPT